ncbi:MAG: right-handed parallel beta-helix repeat-containing protein, partial [Methanobacteriota archaeon]
MDDTERRRLVAATLIVLTAASPALTLFSFTCGRVSAATIEHEAIFIDSPEDFTPENGVSGGDGSFEDPFIIEGLEIGAGPYSVWECIHISNVNSHVIVREVYVHSGYEGINLWNCTNVSVEDSIISDNWGSAIHIRRSHHITISNCSVLSSATSMGHGLLIDSSSYLTITGNQFEGKGIYFSTPEDLYADSPDEWYSSHTITTDNLVDGVALLYYKNQSGIVLDDVSASQVIIAKCSSAAVKGLSITGGDMAVFVVNSRDVTISQCHISRNFVGIHLHNSPGCSVFDNEVTNGYDTGIWLGNGCNGSSITDNFVTGYDNYSLRVEMCSSIISGNTAHDGGGISVGYYVGPVIISNNTVDHCRFGVTAVNMYSAMLTIQGNIVSDCWQGISMTLGSANNISDNSLVGNTYGVM